MPTARSDLNRLTVNDSDDDQPGCGVCPVCLLNRFAARIDHAKDLAASNTALRAALGAIEQTVIDLAVAVEVIGGDDAEDDGAYEGDGDAGPSPMEMVLVQRKMMANRILPQCRQVAGRKVASSQSSSTGIGPPCWGIAAISTVPGSRTTASAPAG
jgi:hypothetical protein